MAKNLNGGKDSFGDDEEDADSEGNEMEVDTPAASALAPEPEPAIPTLQATSTVTTGISTPKNDGGTQPTPCYTVGVYKIQNVFKTPAEPKSKTNVEDKKTPTGAKPVQAQKKIPIPAEPDAVPSKNYRAIISGKQLKRKVGTIGGITSNQNVGVFTTRRTTES